MEVSATTNSYGWLDLDDIPSIPGLYAWYIELRIGKADQSDQTVWLEKLEQLALYHKKPGLIVEAKANMGLEYSGKLDHQHYSSKEQSKPPNVQEISQILTLATPLLSAPIYIGIATNLNIRLGNHKRLINRLRVERDHVNSKGREAPTDEEEDSSDWSFASRIVEREVDVNLLAVHTVELSVEEAASKTLSSSVKTAEFFLNRIHHPLLGRR